jgi:hypothetical protein
MPRGALRRIVLYMSRRALTTSQLGFQPPFCPQPGCPWHTATDLTGWRFERRGSRPVQRSPKPVQRFRCTTCGRWFCDAAFTSDYWRKIAGLLPRVYPLLADGPALRQVGRMLRLSVTTIRRVERRLAQQALLQHLADERALAGRLTEPLVLDGQRSITGSRYEPAETYGVFTAEAGFCLELRSFGLRRSGSMSPRQKQIRAEREKRLGRPDPRARRRIHAAALRRLAALVPADHTLELRSDEETDFVPAIRALAAKRPVRHVTVSSRARRDVRNPLWMINHKHRLQRHCLASHRRQTIAAHKTLAGLQDRQLVSRCWLNHTKGVSERTAAGRRTTPALRLGVSARPRSGRSLFARRRFPIREGLPHNLRAVYEGRVKGRPGERPSPTRYRFAY